MRLTYWNNEVTMYKDTAISGNLDVGSSIKTNYSSNGYTGSAELSTPTPWDWNLNFETDRPNWGWFYLTVKGAAYMQIASSAERVTIYKKQEYPLL